MAAPRRWRSPCFCSPLPGCGTIGPQWTDGPGPWREVPPVGFLWAPLMPPPISNQRASRSSTGRARLRQIWSWFRHNTNGHGPAAVRAHTPDQRARRSPTPMQCPVPDGTAPWEPMTTQLPSTAHQRRHPHTAPCPPEGDPRGRRDAGRPVATAALRWQPHDAAGHATSRLRTHNSCRCRPLSARPSSIPFPSATGLVWFGL